jgi:hypothetical protein
MSRWLWFLCLSFQTKTIYSLEERTLLEERYLVLQVERLGMANRLRVVADWYHLAQISNRHLLLSWVPSIDCNISFPELFVDGPPQFSVLATPLPAGARAAHLASAMAADSHLSFAQVLVAGQPSTDATDFFLNSPTDRALIFDTALNVLFTNYDGSITLPETPCQAHFTMRSLFYSSLVPVPEVQSMLNDVLEYFRNRSRSLFGPVCLTIAQSHDWSSRPHPRCTL